MTDDNAKTWYQNMLDLFGEKPERDGARIGSFTCKFAELWETMPDLRFFQVVSVIETRLKVKGCRDAWNVEENITLTVIEELLDEQK